MKDVKIFVEINNVVATSKGGLTFLLGAATVITPNDTKVHPPSKEGS
jgi:hypothetical protein